MTNPPEDTYEVTATATLLGEPITFTEKGHTSANPYRAVRAAIAAVVTDLSGEARWRERTDGSGTFTVTLAAKVGGQVVVERQTSGQTGGGVGEAALQAAWALKADASEALQTLQDAEDTRRRSGGERVAGVWRQ